MGLMCVVILCFSITFLQRKANSSESEVFAIPGCNATLEWILGQTYLTSYTYKINVSNANGIEIARMYGMKCKYVIDSSMYCEVRNISDKEWRFSVVFINVTQANSGKYTGRIGYGMRNETNTKELKIIDKPQIRKSQKSILHKPLHTACTVNGEFDDLIYHWKLNGTYFKSTKRINASSSYLTFERLTMGDNSSLFSCTVCSEINCCIESEPYAPDPYYGPDNVTLSLNESDIYLRVNESFKVKCSAKCYPVCSFLWDGYIHIQGENGELVINRFDSRMHGVYTCIATNLETNETARSSLLFLHYVQDISIVASSPADNGDLLLKQYWIGWIGPGVVSALLLIVGSLIFVTHWRKNISKGIDARQLRDAENSRRQCSMEGSAKRSRLIKLLTKVPTENKAANEDYDTGTRSRDLSNTRQENVETKLQKDMYSTVDENALSFYDYARGNVIEGNSHATQSSSKHGYYDDAPFKEMCHVETADIHVTDDNYITPINDPVCPIELCENGTTDALGIDQTYITPISDHTCPINICQGVETNLLKTDETYITPITE